jgi:hypothetical protein
MRASLTAELKSIEHGVAIFTLADGQELRVSKEDIQPLPEVGAAFNLTIVPAEEAALEQEKLAKTLLNQILGNDS